ncbi:MotA/TolQ/ExbB proton channel family protein [Saccharospirillum salsuginis]|uniref:Biopolymer transporter ExbB n=1 Tax=Saccharospirillum salsuginis TaxID=418750 RepID=A0A918K6J4_9GAMM|nr:MotA/TolQ/ExbB proton channel family protein [Saccharospirillum salsuginis]GGX51762.1 biopolymer transporter ExbB [Saccharospirillum salsuginis]
MFEIIKAGGWLMVPIVLCSVIAIAIIVERYWALRLAKVKPKDQLPKVWMWIKNQELDSSKLKELKGGSLFGYILSSGLTASKHGREAMKDAIQEAGTHVAHEMEKFLSTLGTIAAVSPLLGLLGTVLGMIEVFTAIMVQGTGNTGVLAGGISQALITTAAGLSVAIPALIFHRALSRRVDELLVSMEQDSAKLVDAIHSDASGN